MLYRLTPPAGLEWTDFPGHGDLFDTVLKHGADLDRLEWQRPEERAFSADLLRIALRHGHRTSRGLVVSATHLVHLGRANKLRLLAHEAGIRSADLRKQNGALMETLMPGWSKSGIELDARVLTSTERSATESEADLADVLAAPVDADLAAHWESLGGSLPD